MPVNRLDDDTFRRDAQLLAADTETFNDLVRLAGLDPARDFRHTDMSGTSMAGADLRGFDFTGADFRNVTLDGALLDGACFRGADLRGTDLSAVRGLEAADCSFAVSQDAPFAPEMVVLPAGSFLMGSPSDALIDENSRPQRTVDVASFAIGRYPVTFAEFDNFCEASGRELPDGEGWGRGRQPAINVSWLDARVYAQWLAEVTGKAYRLPSEAEWEYACRANTTTAYWWGDAFDQAMTNTGASGHRKTTKVGLYPANSWGLFDTLGNVWEWAEDSWRESYFDAPSDSRAWVAWAAEDSPRILRGGSWGSYQVFARSAYRHRNDPGFRSHDVGFRVACSSPS